MGKNRKYIAKIFHSLFGVVLFSQAYFYLVLRQKQPEMSRVIEPHICKTAVRAFRSLPMRI